MILAIDVHYPPDSTAVAAGILFAMWESDEPVRELVVTVAEPASYVPGSFYLRELPSLLAVVAQVTEPLDCIVIDCYVHLGPERKPGLGMRLWRELGERVPVIGVAKTRFQGTPAEAELLRGGSRRPLYITAAGIGIEEAKRCIARMKGANRIPDLLKRVDRLSRSVT